MLCDEDYVATILHHYIIAKTNITQPHKSETLLLTNTYAHTFALGSSSPGNFGLKMQSQPIITWTHLHSLAPAETNWFYLNHAI